jgi:hypothetical protein
MKRKLETKVGAAVYATRKFIVEPSSGRSNRHVGSGNFSYAGSRKYEESGP